jgi:predicted porin
MASALGLARLGRALGVASLLAGVSTAALADPDPQPDSRDARIQQLQDQVRQLVADHQRLQAEDDQLVAKAQQLEAEVDALKQGQAAQGAAIQSQSQSIQTVEAQAPAAAVSKADDGSLTWHGITIYGTYDIGVSWVSHGLPENASNYEGESLVNRNGAHSQFLIAPDNLSQTGLGIRGKEEFLPGWFGVFNASTGFVPQTGQLANLAATNTSNAGLPRKSYSFAGDGARAGQPFNDELYVGLSSDRYGTLTAGRQRALGTDAMLQYDPAAGAYAFSFIGYNGLMAGGGDTQDTRWDSALKYRVAYGPMHFGAMYKFADGQGGCFSASAAWSAATCTPEQPHNSAYGFDIGGAYRDFSADVVIQHVNQAISVLNPLLGPGSPSAPFQSTSDSIDTNPVNGANLIGTANTEYGIVTDNTAVMVAAKYKWNQFRFFGGYEYIRYTNPANPLGVGATAQGGYLLSGVEDNNLDSPKKVQVAWTGVKYAYNSRTDLTFSYYYEGQNDFRVPATCSPAAGFRSSCAGQLNEVSFYVDYRLSKRFDVFTGVAYSDVSGGLAIAIPHGPGVPYFFDDNIAPVVGGRYAF